MGGKSKVPHNQDVSRGIAAYQQVVRSKGMSLPPAPGSTPPEIPAKKNAVSGRAENPAGLQAANKPPREGFLKAGVSPARERGEGPGAEHKKKTSKYRRIAQFLVLAGSDKAAEILSRLERPQVELISREIADIKTISPGEAREVMDEFRSLLSAPFQYGGSAEGGLDEARRLLYAAFGPARGEALLQKAVPKALANPFDFLEEFSGSQLALLFRDESPAAEALVLSRLPTNLSASVLAHTNYGRKLELVRRIARMGETAPEVLDRAAGALKEKVRHFSPAESPDAGIDGMGVLSAILKASDISFGDRLLDELEYRDPGLGRSLKDRLCTLEDVAAVPDRPIEEKLRSMSDRDIMLLLKNPEDVFTQKIRSNLSHGREERIREDAELAGAVPKIEVQAAAREFLAWFRAEGPWLEEETAENVLAGGGEGL